MAKRRKRRGAPSEAKREQGRALAARMKREGGRFVGIEEPGAQPAAGRATTPSKEAATASKPAAPRAALADERPSPPRRSRAAIETQDQELVAHMHGRSAGHDDSLLARGMRRRERRLDG